ncbi:hypothetical protein GCM10010508_53900 [Streptomyces naganishii JCM 4654]|uniref:Uncharacterized protein n=1 Tax=Streptomyces naganishii JCM 4654 TaxID=1306179 RepID=A0A918Y8Y2_9ACTN|nr:hypothetical protein GCM10010508_53900 [Streptomyces naganishii JCM 4654]
MGGVPSTICGTRIDGGVVRSLFPSVRGLREFSRVDANRATSAPCLLLSGRDPVLELNFYWTVEAPDVTHFAESRELLLRIEQLRNVDKTSAVGNNGGISTAPCNFRGKNYFTLTFRLPQLSPADPTHRKDIEKFMRAYFPATVRTLGCERTSPSPQT